MSRLLHTLVVLAFYTVIQLRRLAGSAEDLSDPDIPENPAGSEVE